jgi:AcrR family transcriptional regulator
MNHLFAALPREKQEKILTACVQEFAEKGFQESSTNRMIEKAGIAKGSLFKYFGSKEELYIYVLDQAAAELLAEYTAQAVNLSRDLVSRIIQLAEIEMRIHLRRTKQFRLFKQALVEDGSKLSQRVRNRYGALAEKQARLLLEDVDATGLAWDLPQVLQGVSWLLQGFNENFLARLPGEYDLESSMDQYLVELRQCLELISSGIYIDDRSKKNV